MTQLVALPDGTELAGDYRIERVLGAGGFGVTYLASETALSRSVSIKEYFPSDFAARANGMAASPRSQDCSGDYNWGLERFIEEAQTLARFDHNHIVKVYRVFRANNTAYMVLQFEEGQSLKAWLKGLGRAPRQKELDAIIAPLLDALEVIHKAAVLHRDIAPDNIIIRKGGDPVLIDFGAARGDIAAHSKTKTVSALVKPGYSPYEQYAETTRQQGPWTDIYALAATLYHAVTGKRPPDSPSRMLNDEMIATRDAALGAYRTNFLNAIQAGLALTPDARPQSVAQWRGALLAPDPQKPGMLARLREKTEVRRDPAQTKRDSNIATGSPPPPDAPGPKGGMLDYVDALKATPTKKPAETEAATAKPAPPNKPAKAKKAAAAPEPPKAKAKAEPAAKLPALPPPALPAKTPRAKDRTRPKPDVARRPLTRGLKTKLITAAALSGLVFAFQDQIPKLLALPSHGITTGAISATSFERKIAQSGEFKAHDVAIDSLALSGDGRLLVTAAHDGTLRIWSAETQQQLGSIELESGPATSLSVRNNRAVTGHADGSIAVYDLDTHHRLFSFKRNDAMIWAVRFTGSEERIAAASHDWTVSLWESSRQSEPAALLEGHKNAVQALAVDPLGQWLASGGADRTVRLWNLDTQQMRRTYRNHSDFVSALAFSSDSATLAAGSLDGSIKLWSTLSGRLQRTFTGHKSRITSIAFSPDDNLIASAAEDGAVRVRGYKRTRLYWSLNGIADGGLMHGASTLTFSNDGRTLLTGGRDGVVRLWTLPEPQLAQSVR